MNPDIYLVSRPEDIVEAWPLVKDGFTTVMRKGHGEETHDYILSQLINNQLFLWVIFKDKKYVGFITTKKIFQNYKGNNVGVLFVNHWYKNTSGLDREMNQKLNEFVDNHARESGCKFVKMNTARDNQRFWGDLGFQKTYVEYIKELSEV